MVTDAPFEVDLSLDHVGVRKECGQEDAAAVAVTGAVAEEQREAPTEPQEGALPGLPSWTPAAACTDTVTDAPFEVDLSLDHVGVRKECGQEDAVAVAVTGAVAEEQQEAPTEPQEGALLGLPSRTPAAACADTVTTDSPFVVDLSLDHVGVRKERWQEDVAAVAVTGAVAEEQLEVPTEPQEGALRQSAAWKRLAPVRSRAGVPPRCKYRNCCLRQSRLLLEVLSRLLWGRPAKDKGF